MIRKIRPQLNGTPTNADATFKKVPERIDDRERIRRRADETAASLDRTRPLKRDALDALARTLLADLELPLDYLGFAMVAVSNAFWQPQFAAVPFRRRLLLLPHCLRRIDACRGVYDTVGLHCAGCGACPITDLQRDAETLGYRVMVAEGTPAVLQFLLRGETDALMGVACLDSLEKAFEHVADLGIPNVAAPLLVDGCVETTAELTEVSRLMHLSAASTSERTRSYVPLLRAAERLFEPGILDALLAGEIHTTSAAGDVHADPMHGAERLSLDWLRAGGKRFRPFVVLAAFAAMKLGEDALHPDADLTDAFPDVVQRAAVAVEALHKASLVHDDIEDDDAFRYGCETLHRRYGVATAINVGDDLIGLGYRLIASGADELSAEAVADMLGVLSRSHLRLARGQGAELLLRDREACSLRPIDLLSIYALKTAPAFEAALTVGLRAAGPVAGWADRLAAYSRYLGIAYQVLNDLKDWTTDAGDKRLAGQDLLSMRPTVLTAFAFEAGDETSNDALTTLLRSDAPEAVKVSRVRHIYEERGVFDKAETLVAKYRKRAVAAATGMTPPALGELLHFIVDVVLR